MLVNKSKDLKVLVSKMRGFKKKLLPVFGLGDNSRCFSVIPVFSLAKHCRENNNKNNLPYMTPKEKAKHHQYDL